jgi:demethylmenaquinone methyltransferase/2-methoxy-6-polyprenyl-1,4-benzoquinol methylase
LEIGRNIVNKKNLSGIELLRGDSLNLIFENNKFDAVTVSFGVRNFQNLEMGLKEMLRVLKPGGKVMILEFSQPNKFVQPFYKFYSSVITPGIGKLISKDKAAYNYLHESVSVFPAGRDFCAILEKTGYRNVSYKPLTFGIATIYTGVK